MNVFKASLNLFYTAFSSLLYIILKSKNKVNHLYREFHFIFLSFYVKINKFILFPSSSFETKEKGIPYRNA